MTIINEMFSIFNKIMNGLLRVLIRIASILMSTHNIQSHNKKISLNICFLERSEKFRRD